MSDTMETEEPSPAKQREVIRGTQDLDKLIKSKLEKATEENPVRAAIFGHPYPDPDCISSQMGMAWLLLRHYNIESDCFYQGEISHPQNNAMNNLLEPNLRRASEDYKPEDYALNILVDTIPDNAGTDGKKIKWDVVIDHHKTITLNGCKALFIHAKTGSCAAIVYHLMEKIATDVWLDTDNELDGRVATGLISGIITDTEYMISDDSTELEFDAFKSLFPFRSANNLRDIVFFKRPKSWIDMSALACSEAEIDGEGYAIVGLGLIPEKQRDIVAAVADEMLTWSSVETAIAFAVVGSNKVVGSVRSANASLSVHDLCLKLGGEHGSGGGKKGKGAYSYSLGGFLIDPDDDDDINQQTWNAIKTKEVARIFRMLRE